MGDSGSGMIFVASDYAQPGRRNQAAYDFAVTVDGKFVGLVAPQESMSFSVTAGSHQVRVSLMWFKSPILSVMVPAEGQVVLRAGVNGKLNSPSLFIRGMFAPFTALRLEQVS